MILQRRRKEDSQEKKRRKDSKLRSRSPSRSAHWRKVTSVSLSGTPTPVANKKKTSLTPASISSITGRRKAKKKKEEKTSSKANLEKEKKVRLPLIRRRVTTAKSLSKDREKEEN